MNRKQLAKTWKAKEKRNILPTATEKMKKSVGALKYCVGKIIPSRRYDVEDELGKWHPAEVLWVVETKLGGSTVRVHYFGWGPEWNETLILPRDRFRMAPLHTFTSSSKRQNRTSLVRGDKVKMFLLNTDSKSPGSWETCTVIRARDGHLYVAVDKESIMPYRWVHEDSHRLLNVNFERLITL